MKFQTILFISFLPVALGCSDDNSTSPGVNLGLPTPLPGLSNAVEDDTETGENPVDPDTKSPDDGDVAEVEAVADGDTNDPDSKSDSSAGEDSGETPLDTENAEEDAGEDAGEDSDTLAPEEDTTSPEEDTTSPEEEALAPGAAGIYAVNDYIKSVEVAPLGTLEIHAYPHYAEPPWPLVVFAPGFTLTSENFDWLGEHLASHGFAVMIPTFGDSFISAFDHADLATAMSSMVDIALGDKSPFGGNIDPTRIAMAGHSRGGKAAILASIQDDRVIAVFTLDPVDSVGDPFAGMASTPKNPSVTPEMMGDLSIPAGFVGAGKGADGFVACAPSDNNYHAYFMEASSPAYEWLLPEAGHNDFAEDLDFLTASGCPSNADSAEVISFSKATMHSFLQVYLNGDSAYQPWLDGDKVDSMATVQTQ